MTYLEQVMKRQNQLALQLESPVPELMQAAYVVTAASPQAEQEEKREAPAQNAPQAAEGERLLLERLDAQIHASEKITAVRQQLLQLQKQMQQQTESEKGMLRRADSRSGGLVAGSSVVLQSSGTAGYDTRQSMAEISRFFERDARRYGG